MKKTNGAVRVHRGQSLGATWQDWIVKPLAEKKLPPNLEQPVPVRPSHEAIAQLAYAIWEQRGRPIGSPEQDWVRAEQALLQEHDRQ
jgi:hypothetical protein